MVPSLLRDPVIGSSVGRSTGMLRLEDLVLTSTDTLDLNNEDLEDFFKNVIGNAECQ